MPKIRINRKPVSKTLSGVDRSQATIEAEGGETVLGDINQDGYLEHFNISGPKHSKGGVPLDVPQGSFVFSDTPKLRIKDAEILKNFTKTASKKGYTPAQIARQYEINQYMDTLKDPDADPIAQRTARLMLDANTKKLQELSMVQEQMKGMPNGVPQVAESATMGMEMPQMSDGGMKTGLSPGEAKAMYQRALKTKDPVVMRNTAKYIRDHKNSALHSFAWVKGSDEWYFDEYEDKLEEDAYYLEYGKDVAKKNATYQDAYGKYKQRVNSLYDQYKGLSEEVFYGRQTATDEQSKLISRLAKEKQKLDQYERLLKSGQTKTTNPRSKAFIPGLAGTAMPHMGMMHNLAGDYTGTQIDLMPGLDYLNQMLSTLPLAPGERAGSNADLSPEQQAAGVPRLTDMAAGVQQPADTAATPAQIAAQRKKFLAAQAAAAAKAQAEKAAKKNPAAASNRSSAQPAARAPQKKAAVTAGDEYDNDPEFIKHLEKLKAAGIL